MDKEGLSVGKRDCYVIDESGVMCASAIRAGATLYRLASLSHWREDELLTGGGALAGGKGRYHHAHQRASYCGNNALLCIAERLFHMHCRLLKILAGGSGRSKGLYKDALLQCEYTGMLVVFTVDEIENLIHVASEEAQFEYDQRLGATTLVCPLETYNVLNDCAQKIREDGRRGLVFPSARHSRDVGYVFFGDETDAIQDQPYMGISIRLQIVPEDQAWSEAPNGFNPFKQRAHQTMGYYEVLDEGVLKEVHENGLIYPGMPARGFVDFVRRTYKSYPEDAVRV